jgi:hypothetical protein
MEQFMIDPSTITTQPEAMAKVRAYITGIPNTPAERRGLYIRTRYGPLLREKGYCDCGRRISLNKTTCAAHAGMEPQSIMPGQEDELGPGITGYKIEYRGATYYPLLISREEGKCHMRAFLDSLRGPVKVPCVTSDVLRGMLDRRGYVRTLEVEERFGEEVEVWVKDCGCD